MNICRETLSSFPRSIGQRLYFLWHAVFNATAKLKYILYPGLRDGHGMGVCARMELQRIFIISVIYLKMYRLKLA